MVNAYVSLASFQFHLLCQELLDKFVNRVEFITVRHIHKTAFLYPKVNVFHLADIAVDMVLLGFWLLKPNKNPKRRTAHAEKLSGLVFNFENHTMIKSNYTFDVTSQKEVGKLSDISRVASKILGDQSGRTISRRTADGFTRVSGAQNLHPDTSVDVIHGAMVTTGLLLFSNNRNAVVAGSVGVFLLFACYHVGR